MSAKKAADIGSAAGVAVAGAAVGVEADVGLAATFGAVSRKAFAVAFAGLVAAFGAGPATRDGLAFAVLAPENLRCAMGTAPLGMKDSNMISLAE